MTRFQCGDRGHQAWVDSAAFAALTKSAANVGSHASSAGSLAVRNPCRFVVRTSSHVGSFTQFPFPSSWVPGPQLVPPPPSGSVHSVEPLDKNPSPAQPPPPPPSPFPCTQSSSSGSQPSSPSTNPLRSTRLIGSPCVYA